MSETAWLQSTSPAFRLMIATSWLAPDNWRERQEQAIREAVAASPDWSEYVRLVDRHRTPALSWASLNRVSGLEVPETTKGDLQMRSNSCKMQALRHAQLLAEILKAFNSADIPVMPLKGPLLSLELYGDLGLRQSKDLDLMVARRDIARARACLEKLNWNLDPEGFYPATPRQWEIFWRNDGEFDFCHPPGDHMLELHFRNYREDETETEERWAGSISSVWHEYPYRAMSAMDQAVYLCVHGGEHAWFRAKWLGDLARIHTDQTVDWEVALQRATTIKRERELLAGLLLLKEVYGLRMPDLPGEPWKQLPAFITNEQLRCLKVPDEFGERSARTQFVDQIRKFHHDRLLRPNTTLWQNLAAFTYRSADFKEFPLPDRFSWVYPYLRPFLWIWRRIRRAKQQNLRRDQSRSIDMSCI